MNQIAATGDITGSTTSKMGAPFGIRHGKATVPFETVEAARGAYEIEGLAPAEIAKKYNVNINTLWDWLEPRKTAGTPKGGQKTVVSRMRKRSRKGRFDSGSVAEVRRDGRRVRTVMGLW